MEKTLECIQAVIETYYTSRYSMLGKKIYVDFRWHHFFAPTLQGRKTYWKERKLLEQQITHCKKQVVELGFEKFYIKPQWYSVDIQGAICKVTMQLNIEIFYKGLQNRKSIKNADHYLRLIKIAGNWYIENDDYFNEFQLNSPMNRKNKILKGKMREDLRPKGIYKREKAVAYAKKYAVMPNIQQWKNYTKWGGDCTNFISQCLYAGEIPFDHAGRSITEKWYWYSDDYRTPSWTSADALKTYMLTNKGYGLVAKISDLQHMELGDVVQLGTFQETTHSMLVVDIIYKDNNKKEIVDLLIAQHSDDGGIFGYDIPLSSKPPARLYYKILGYNPQYT